MHKCARLSLSITNEVNKKSTCCQKKKKKLNVCLNTNAWDQCIFNLHEHNQCNTQKQNTLDLCEDHHLVTEYVCKLWKTFHLWCMGKDYSNSLMPESFVPCVFSVTVLYSNTLFYNHLCTNDGLALLTSKLWWIGNRPHVWVREGRRQFSGNFEWKD